MNVRIDSGEILLLWNETDGMFFCENDFVRKPRQVGWEIKIPVEDRNVNTGL